MRSNVIRCRGAPVCNDDPIGGEIIQATAAVMGATSREYAFDVNSYVNAQRAAGHDVVGFMIQAGAVTSSSIIDFNSKEASSGKPALVLSESGPSVATPAAASPSTVTGTTTSLSVLGADPAGESTLTYTWYTVSQPTGGSLSVSATGTNAAKDVTAYFAKPGTYSMYALITDADSNSISSNTLTFTVVATLTTITVTPTPAALNENATQQFAASGLDQFGVALASQPTFSWTNSGVGSVNSTGLYTAPGSAGTATVTATSGSVSANAAVTVGNAAPTVATAASASPSPVTAKTTTLSALGADDGGESNLTYTWTATIPSGAAAPTYSANGTNAAKSDTATFTSAGAYIFKVTITDQGSLYVTSSVSVTVSQTLTSMSVTPGTATVGSGGTQQFAASALDQFGQPIASAAVTWSVDTGGAGGSIDSAGLYTAPATGAGADTVRAASGGLSATASIAVSGSPQADAPSQLTADGNPDGSITVGWTPGTGDSDTFYIYRSDSGVAGTYASVGESSDGSDGFTDSSSLTPATTYFYTVRAADANNPGGYSPYSAAVSAATAGPMPTNLTAAPASESEIDLMWLADAESGPFVVQRSDDGGTSYATIATLATGTTSYDDADPALVPDTQYSYLLGTADGSGNVTPATSAVSAMTFQAAPAVTAADIEATQNADFNGAVATFTDADPLASPGGYTADVDWGDGAQSTGTVTASGGEFTVTADHTFDTAGGYDVNVTVTDSNGNQGYADASATVAQCVPDVPANLTATANGGTEIDLTWDDSELASGYNVYRSTDGASFTLIDTTGAGVDFYNDTNGGNGLSGNITYYYQVAATNDAGASANSSTASATTADNAPVAVDDGPADASEDQPYIVGHNSTIDIPVLANDSDPDSDPLTIASAQVAPGSQGSVEIIGSGSGEQQVIEYTPGSGADAIGLNQITYTASDGTLSSNTATATVEVTNALPVASSGTFYDGSFVVSGPDGPVQGPVTGVLPAADADTDPLTYTEVAGPADGGSFSVISSTGQFTYVPPASGNGGPPNETVVFKANDGIGDSNYASLTFVGSYQCGPGGGSGSNQYSVIPLGNSDAGAVLSGQTLSGTVPLADDSYPLQANLVSDDPGNPAAGGPNVQLNSDGTYTYTAPAGFSGTDWFTYYLTDSDGNRSNYATVFVDVKPLKTALVWSDQPTPADSSFVENINVDDQLDSNGVPNNQDGLPPAVGDPLLSELNLNVNTGGITLPDGSTETLSLTSGAANVSVWMLNGSTYQQILGGSYGSTETWTPGAMPTLVYVQGLSAGDTQFNLDVTVAGQSEGDDATTSGSASSDASSANGPATTQAAVSAPEIGVYYTLTSMQDQEVRGFATNPSTTTVESAYVPYDWIDSDNLVKSDVAGGNVNSDNIAKAQPQEVPDFEQSNGANGAGVSGDNSLVRMVLHNLKPHVGQNGGGYDVKMTGGSAKGLLFFQTADKTGPLQLSTMRFDPAPGNDYVFWVEAVLFNSAGNGTNGSNIYNLQLEKLTFNGANPNLPPRKAPVGGNQVQLDVYQVLGVQNVPGGSTCTYSVAGPGLVQSQGKSGPGTGWATDAGSPAQITSAGFGAANGPAQVGVTFGAGADFENVNYSITDASGGVFRFTLPVNVVKVTVAAVAGTPEISTYPGKPVNAGPAGYVTSAPAPFSAMTAEVQVTLTGPRVAATNQMVGVGFIDVGFMQFVTSITRTYNNGTTWPGVDNGSSPRLDTTYLARGQSGNENPWYDTTGYTWQPSNGQNAHALNGLFRGAYGFNWATGQPNQPLTDTIGVMDTPVQAVVSSTGIIATATNALSLAFAMCLVTHTIDTAPLSNGQPDKGGVNGSADAYNYLSSGDWTFNASGRINNGVWSAPAVGPAGDSVPGGPSFSVNANDRLYVQSGPIPSSTPVYNEFLKLKRNGTDQFAQQSSWKPKK